uniref:Zinc finger FYVE domain-containing protein 26 n=1 Tax=Lygus hesperus TaxID=30085 RepID=A0A0A9YEM4_LYGHE
MWVWISVFMLSAYSIHSGSSDAIRGNWGVPYSLSASLGSLLDSVLQPKNGAFFDPATACKVFTTTGNLLETAKKAKNSATTLMKKSSLPDTFPMFAKLAEELSSILDHSAVQAKKYLKIVKLKTCSKTS